MSAPDRRAMVERSGKDLSVRRQCALVGVARSGIYRPKPVAGGDDLAVMRRIDELHLELPFYGSRRMTFELNKEGRGVNRKRVRRLMRVMGIEALVPRPGTSKAAPGHKIYPYLLRGLKIVEPNHVWAADVTFIPMACGFLYLVVIIDWASRAVLAWRLSNTNDASFCAAALEEALLRFGTPRIFNTDQGSTFTAEAFAGKLAATGVAISMDGRGRFMDNIFIERLWRSIKYEEVHLKAYADAREARAGIGSWMTFYNFRRPHQAMNNQMPMAVWRAGMDKIEAAARAVDMPLRLDNANAFLPTAEAARSGLILEGQGQARSHLKSNVPWSHEWGPVQWPLVGRAVSATFILDLAFVKRSPVLLFEKEPGRGLVGHEHIEVARPDAGAHDGMLLRARRDTDREFPIGAIAQIEPDGLRFLLSVVR